VEACETFWDPCAGWRKAGVNEIEKLAGHMSGIVLEVMKDSMLSDIAKSY
jgi:hypothetical protein